MKPESCQCRLSTLLNGIETQIEFGSHWIVHQLRDTLMPYRYVYYLFMFLLSPSSIDGHFTNTILSLKQKAASETSANMHSGDVAGDVL